MRRPRSRSRTARREPDEVSGTRHRPREGRRAFLRTSASAGVGLALADQASAQGGAPRDLRLGQVQIIDLSVALEHDAAGERTKPRIEYVTHDAGGLKGMMETFGAAPNDFVYSNGHGWAVENLTVGSHTATHIDAPYHYGATSEGKPARRIDEVPLEWCFAPGVVLDMRHRKPGEVISTADLQRGLRDIAYTLQAGDIVLIHTGAAARWGTPEYFRQPGLDRDSTLWLVNQGIRVIGIDAWTLDREFAAQIEDFKRTGDGRHIWPAHFAGITKEYCQIEKLANLERLPRPHGFYVSCLPVKIKGGSAGWCRAVALVPRS
jgi:kynurenine formamidase